jgi:hypothetical protein
MISFGKGSWLRMALIEQEQAFLLLGSRQRVEANFNVLLGDGEYSPVLFQLL